MYNLYLTNIDCSMHDLQESTDRLDGLDWSNSLGEADVGADGVFVPALSGVEARRVALVTRRVLFRKKQQVQVRRIDGCVGGGSG